MNFSLKLLTKTQESDVLNDFAKKFYIDILL